MRPLRAGSCAATKACGDHDRAYTGKSEGHAKTLTTPLAALVVILTEVSVPAVVRIQLQ